MKTKHILSLLASFLIITACQDKKKEEAINSVKEWIGKEILFPKSSVFTIRGIDTIDFALMLLVIKLCPTLIRLGVSLAN